MLSPHNVHQNAAKIAKVGADVVQLTNALCIELAASGRQREENMKANELLISKANGLLPTINGQERYLTLGCGHTTAFCKLADQGGITNQSTLQTGEEGDTTIAVHKLKQNSNWKQMLEEGWKWDVVVSDVDIEFPEFAKVAQRALNTSNHVATQASELEAMVTMPDCLNSMGSSEQVQRIAVQSIKDLCVPCSEYADKLKDFVKAFGGGEGAPLIVFLDSVAKEFKCHVALGASYWTCLTDSQLGDKICARPFCRVALALCNLQCDEIEDGIAKLLLPVHVRKLNGKAGSGYDKCLT